MRRDDGEVRDLLNAGYRYAMSLTGDRQDAEDLVHEAWLKIHETNGNSTHRPLLYTAIRNLFIDQVRRRRRFRVEAYDELQAYGHHGPEAFARLAVSEMETALLQLRPEEREAIYLNAVEGYSTEEIARSMKCPRGTVLSYIHRGRRKLIAILNGTRVALTERKGG